MSCYLNNDEILKFDTYHSLLLLNHNHELKIEYKWESLKEFTSFSEYLLSVFSPRFDWFILGTIKEQICDQCGFFKVKYNLSITNKVHIIFSHIQEVIYKTGKGLGEGSEQSLEACHHKFDVIWQWYKVKDHQSPNHGEQLFKCVQHFNSFNIWK